VLFEGGADFDLATHKENSSKDVDAAYQQNYDDNVHILKAEEAVVSCTEEAS
jgi:hypothetical protein